MDKGSITLALKWHNQLQCTKYLQYVMFHEFHWHNFTDAEVWLNNYNMYHNVQNTASGRGVFAVASYVCSPITAISIS